MELSMKNTKMLFLLVGTIMSAMLNGHIIDDGNHIYDHKQLGLAKATATLFRNYFLKTNASDISPKAIHSLYNAIDDCDKTNYDHESRMNELRNNSQNVSISDFRRLLRSQQEFAKIKAGYYNC